MRYTPVLFLLFISLAGAKFYGYKPRGCYYLKRQQWYVVGPVPSVLNCQTCECLRQGYVKCTDKSNIECSDLPCPPEEQERKESNCCKTCKPGCSQDGVWYRAGDVMPGMECDECFCGVGGSSVCKRQDCPRLSCPAGLQLAALGEQCCPSCLQTVRCRYSGEYYNPGEPIPVTQPCLTCECGADGKLDCAVEQCPQISCSNGYMYKRRGKCCAECS